MCALTSVCHASANTAVDTEPRQCFKTRKPRKTGADWLSPHILLPERSEAVPGAPTSLALRCSSFSASLSSLAFSRSASRSALMRSLSASFSSLQQIPKLRLRAHHGLTSRCQRPLQLTAKNAPVLPLKVSSPFT